jgi:hypothetical protein
MNNYPGLLDPFNMAIFIVLVIILGVISKDRKGSK